MQVRLQSDGCMSNRRWHEAGKPNWWARIGSGQTARFLELPRVRGDQRLDVTAEVPEGTKEVVIGVGPNNRYGVRETIRVS